MHFDFFEIEDNFVPDFATDPYRRKHVRTRICIKEGESMSEAITQAETFIKEYIYDHTVSTPPSTYTYPLEPIPDIQVQKEPELNYEAVIEGINKCTTKQELKDEWQLISYSSPKTIQAYTQKLKALQQ